LIGAEKQGRKIAVEVKSFIGHSKLHDLYKALGQYVFYIIELKTHWSSANGMKANVFEIFCF